MNIKYILMYFIVLTFIVSSTYILSGCSVDRAISDNLQEEKFIHGCKAVQAKVGIGYLPQTGQVSVPCKLKCSKELPKGYCLKYSSKTPYGNCYLQAGSCVTEEVSK